jgi:MATE family multidrug resistance protein
MAPRESPIDEEQMVPTMTTTTTTTDRDSFRPAVSLEEQATEETSLLMMIPTHNSSIRQRPRREHWPVRVKREVIEQSKTFLPALQSMILSKIPWFITLRILGEMDARNASEGGVELAAAALATTLCNVTGLSLCVGFSFALSTLAGQAKGELLSRSTSASQTGTNSVREGEDTEVPNTPVVFLLRGMIVQLLLVVPVGIWWLFGIDSFLIRLGQTPDLAIHASKYLKILAPSLWVYSIQWTTTAWTQSIGMADVPARAALLGLILHIPFNILFCNVLGYGYLGCAYATICFQTVQCLYIGTYLFVYHAGKERVLESTGGSAVGRTSLTLWKELGIAAGSLRGFCDYLCLAIPGIIVISEWWASECAIFLSGRLSPNPQTTLAAMTIYQSINSFCFMVPCGFAIAGTARVGNLLGAGNASGASLAGKVSVACCAICSGTIGWLLYTMPHGFLPGLFVSYDENPGIIDQTAATIPYLAIYVFADGIQTGLNGIIKGCGRQRIVVPIVVVAYWVVGVPLAYYLGLYRTGGDDTLCAGSDGEGGTILCGDVGLVAGMTAGTWCHMLLLAVVVTRTTDWKHEAYKAKQRVTGDHERQKRKKELRRKACKGDESDDEEGKPLRSSRSEGHLNF